MRSFTDAKAMARSLRSALGDRHLELSHGECLDIVARQFGLDNWNVLSAKIDAAEGDKPAAGAHDGIRLIDAIPMLRIFSVDKAHEFYLDFLGFEIDWEHRFHENAPYAAQISRSGLRLILTEHHGDGSPGAKVLIWMRGIVAYNRELLGKNYRYYRPGIEEVPWDARVMEVGDPFGNKLSFSEPNKPDDPRA